MTGGSGGSTVLYPEGCIMPSIEKYRDSHVTFLTQDSTPRIAICGGSEYVPGRDNKDCLVLHDGQWRGGQLSDLPDYRYWSTSVRLEEGVFVLGGHHTPTSSVFLKAGSSSWVQGPDLPEERGHRPCAAPISAHSFLIVLNVANSQTPVYEFDAMVAGPTSNAGWKVQEKWPQLQVERQYPGCGVINNKFIIAGGNGLKSTDIIDLKTRTLRVAGDMSTSRAQFQLLSIAGSLVAVDANAEEFDEETETWKPTTSLPEAYWGGVVLDKDQVLDLGCEETGAVHILCQPYLKICGILTPGGRSFTPSWRSPLFFRIPSAIWGWGTPPFR